MQRMTLQPLVDEIERVAGLAAGALDAGTTEIILDAFAGVFDGTPNRHVATGTTRADLITRFTEQFAYDVASIDPVLRAEVAAEFGPETFTFVQVVYVFDQFERARRAAQSLIGLRISLPKTPAVATTSGADLWAAIEALMRDIARLEALDPVLTERVRLRGARFHGCRLCQSRRSVRALDAAREIGPPDDADAFDRSDLDSTAQVALELVDSIVTGASDSTGNLRARATALFSPVQLGELIFDVMRNAANKIAVALGADSPNVTSGVEYFDLDRAGEVVADTDPEAVRRSTR